MCSPLYVYVYLQLDRQGEVGREKRDRGLMTARRAVWVNG